jgi:prepilin-type N-terminal cleavage/methylation domain-containing protein
MPLANSMHMPPTNRGYSLLEMSIVMLIIGLLLAASLPYVSAQRRLEQFRQTEAALATIRETLISYAMLHGRLPCPARPDLPDTDPAADNEDRTDASSPCKRQHGTLPAQTLGLGSQDTWGRRYTYFVSAKFSAPVMPGANSSFGLGSGSGSDASGGGAIKSQAGNSSNLAADLPAVIVSHGPNGHGAFMPSGQQIRGASGDELENANQTQSFVAHPPTPAFDDQVDWLIGSVLKARLVAAGKLP